MAGYVALKEHLDTMFIAVFIKNKTSLTFNIK